MFMKISDTSDQSALCINCLGRGIPRRCRVANEYLPHIFNGASSSNRMGCDKNISRDLRHSPRISPSESCTFLPGLAPRTVNKTQKQYYWMLFFFNIFEAVIMRVKLAPQKRSGLSAKRKRNLGRHRRSPSNSRDMMLSMFNLSLSAIVSRVFATGASSADDFDDTVKILEQKKKTAQMYRQL